MNLSDSDTTAYTGPLATPLYEPAPDPSPTPGVTSIPLGSPWPPLSREQVVKLHEALVEFTEGLLGVDPEDEGNWDTVRVADRLEVVLRDLGIGRPAAKMSKRTWTHEEVAKVVEEVQQRSGLPRYAEGRAPTSATELAITAAMEDRFGHITDLSRHSKPREDPTTDEDSGPGAMSWQRAEEFGSPFATQAELDREVQVVKEGLDLLMRAAKANQSLSQGQVEELLQSSADAPRRQDGQWEGPPKRNCWTCKHDFGFGHTTARYCDAMPPRKRGERDTKKQKAIGAWTNAQELDANLMPPKDADGCPGWEPK